MSHRHFDFRRKLSPIQLLILLQLKKKPMYGYEIIKELKKIFEGVWEPKTGTIYPALRRLETRGLIRTELKEDREHYMLTKAGEEALRQNLSQIERELDFTKMYYRCISWHLPPMLKEKIVRKMLEGEHPLMFWPFGFLHLTNEIEDEKTKLELLRVIREFIKKRLEVIDSKIAELEKK